MTPARRIPSVRLRSLAVGVVVLAAAVTTGRPASAGIGTVTARVGGGEAALRYPVAQPGYYRPVVAGGKAFPVARSNFYGLIEFPNSWHEPRMRVVNGVWKLVGIHEGIDITAERGTPILSMTAGVVERVGWTFYCGTRIGIRGTDGYYYLYCHLAAVASGITRGTRVSPGSYLGRVGNTGYGAEEGHRDEFPAHLHFGIQAPRNGPWVNPYPTLVALYSATVRADQRTEANLDRLARGNRAAWQRAVLRAFMGLRPWLGE